MTEAEKKSLHLVGIGVTHSIAYAMHNHIAQSMHLPWTFYSTECETIEHVMRLARDPATAGLVVTMPYKNTVMKHLDELDELATGIGACNNVYYKTGSSDRLVCGTNTDWRGVKGCLLEKGDEQLRPTRDSRAIGLVVGAGGASRAAVYALTAQLHCDTVYILNRDDQEVLELIHDAKKITDARVVHVKTLEQAQELGSPYYIVGTVPDFEPQTEAEKTVAGLLQEFLSRPTKGVLLDMCFKPRRTRMIKLAEKLGWPCVEGTHVIGYQIEEQWRLWAGEERCEQMDRQGAWDVLMAAADSSPGINF
ncbi:hypothetical protein E8E14_008746 [Neopestalotiopsis sp. 37M]|nr:hypothetical protein E8E14_008746 [Neopestalotiopsis sp. 37M]